MTNGRCVAERKAKEASRAELQDLMLGRQLTEEYRRDKMVRSRGAVRLGVRNLQCGAKC